MFPLPSSDQSAQIEVATAGEVLRERHQQPASVLYLDSGRVLLGVHYFSVVLGGVLWSGMVLLLTLTIVRLAWRW